MANEQKEAKKQPVQEQSNSTRIAVNIIVIILVSAVSFAAGFGACWLIKESKNDKDSRPDFGQMRQNGEQPNFQTPGRNRERFTPDSDDENGEAPTRPQRDNSSSDSKSKS